MRNAALIFGVITGMMTTMTLTARASEEGIPRKTGNMTITSYRQPLMMTGGTPQSPDPMLTEPTQIRHMGAGSIEDYVTLDIVAPEKGVWDFTPHQANARLATSLGLGYALYPWVHFYPEWVAEEPGFTPYVNLATGNACRQPSGWAPYTYELSELFYQEMARYLGEWVDGVYVTDVAEYGEMGYPIGYTQWLRPDPHAESAWWCGDAYARADFREKMLARLGSLDAMNSAWGTDFSSAEDIDYPALAYLQSNPDPRLLTPQTRRHVLDFIYWYQDAAALRMRAFVEMAQQHFPNRQYEIKLGHGDEQGISGHSHSSVCRVLKGTEGLAIRSTHASVGYFHVKRVATPARFYGFDFLTEPPGTVPPEKMAERIFTDACAGVNAYFDYPQNPVAYADFHTYIPLLDGIRAETAAAVFFPEADHYLRINQAYPEGFFEAINPLRDVVDYDVVDERLVADGILDHYGLLFVVGNPMLELETVRGLEQRLAQEKPFTLVHIIAEPEPATAAASFTRVDDATVTLHFEGAHQYRQVRHPSAIREDSTTATETELLHVAQESYRQLLGQAGIAPEYIAALTERNGVWSAYFEHRILAYNPTDTPQQVLGSEVAPGAIQEYKLDSEDAS